MTIYAVQTKDATVVSGFYVARRDAAAWINNNGDKWGGDFVVGVYQLHGEGEGP